MSHPKDTGKDSPAQEYQRTPGGGSHGMGGFMGSTITSPGNVMNCPETNEKKWLIHPTPGGGFPGEWGGGGNIKKVREIS